jgi:hypothetical protein
MVSSLLVPVGVDHDVRAATDREVETTEERSFLAQSTD